jgi:hypothetical protein
MPHRLKPPILQKRPAAGTGPGFRKRYEDIERKRAILLDRLERLRHHAGDHPSFKRALVLLNESFRKSSLVQRLALLEAANWVINLIEASSGLI